MTIYIPPFACGIIATLIAEALLLVIIACAPRRKGRKHERREK